MSLLGVSGSLANELGGAVGGFLKNPLTRSFFLYYYLPAAAFLLVQGLLIAPAVGLPALDLRGFEFHADPKTTELTQLLTDLAVGFFSLNVILLLIAPLALGALTGMLSLQITKFFEGLLPFEKPLLRRWLERNKQQSKKLYGPLDRKRKEYFRTARDTGPDSDKALTVAGEIQALHVAIEESNADRSLPTDPNRVTPTALGNTLAIAEEYPFERYGIDAVLFWPRLRAEVPSEELAGLDGTKGVLDGMLNVTLLAYVFGLEAIVVGLIRPFVKIADAAAPGPLLMIGAGILSMLIGWMSYRAAVSAARSMGSQLQTFFDYYRGKVLGRFGLALPEDLAQEKVIWLRLAAFLRRGEPFYFPTEARAPKKKKEDDDKE